MQIPQLDMGSQELLLGIFHLSCSFYNSCAAGSPTYPRGWAEEQLEKNRGDRTLEKNTIEFEVFGVSRPLTSLGGGLLIGVGGKLNTDKSSHSRQSKMIGSKGVREIGSQLTSPSQERRRACIL